MDVSSYAEVWRRVAVGLHATLANEVALSDEPSVMAYHHAHNGRFDEAIAALDAPAVDQPSLFEVNVTGFDGVPRSVNVEPW